jgi:hypothetical protein
VTTDQVSQLDERERVAPVAARSASRMSSAISSTPWRWRGPAPPPRQPPRTSSGSPASTNGDGSVPDGDEGHRLGAEAASRRGAPRRTTIQEPGVVDERDHGPVIGARPERLSVAAQIEPVACDGRAWRKRRHEGGGPARDVVEIREQRPQQVRQRGERQP